MAKYRSVDGTWFPADTISHLSDDEVRKLIEIKKKSTQQFKPLNVEFKKEEKKEKKSDKKKK